MTVRLGLAGAGYICDVYMRSLEAVDGLEVVAVASPNTAEAFAAKWSIPAHFKDYRSMIEVSALDAIAIGAPNDLHYDITLAAADAGVHVLCDKPMALNLEEADTMIAACNRGGVQFLYGENMLFTPMYGAVRDAARQGTAGPPFLVKQTQCHGGPYSPWFWDIERTGGGVLLDLGCHSISTICWVMGAWPEAVTAHLGRYAHAAKTLGEDHSTVLLHFSGDRLGIAENSWAMPEGRGTLEVFGPAGRLAADLQGPPLASAYNLRSHRRGGDPVRPRAWRAWNAGFPQELQHFADVVEGRADPCSTGEDGRRVLEIITAAYESARTGQRVSLPFASDREKPVDHWLDD